MTDETVHGLQVANRGAVIWLRLNRPKRLNAIDTDVARALVDALGNAAADRDARVVVLMGTGSAFSAGADIKATRVRSESPAPKADAVPGTGGRIPMLDLCNEAVLRILELPMPVIAAVNGRTVGIAGSLAAAADIVLIAESARISLGFAKIGLMPDGGATVLLPETIGLRATQEMAFLGRELSASEAVSMGWAHRMVADVDFEHQVEEIAENLAAGPTQAFRHTKAALNADRVDRVRSALALESRGQLELTKTVDHVEAIRAFSARRPPRFCGR